MRIQLLYIKDTKAISLVKIYNNQHKVKYTLNNTVLFTFVYNFIDSNTSQTILNYNEIYLFNNNNIRLKKLKRNVNFMKKHLNLLVL